MLLLLLVASEGDNKYKSFEKNLIVFIIKSLQIIIYKSFEKNLIVVIISLYSSIQKCFAGSRLLFENLKSMLS